LSTTPGKVLENSSEATQKFPEIIHYSREFPQNSPELTEKLPEIVHYIWKIHKEFPQVY